MPYVYILRCGDGSLYTGAALDVRRRVDQHQAGTASKYTRSRRPLSLAWFRRVRTWSRALKLEYQIKRLSRGEKLALVERRAMPPGLAQGGLRGR
jgi:putative endonuclease